MNNEAMIRSHDRVSEDEGRWRVTGRAVHPTATPPFHCVSPRTLLASDGGDLENGGCPENGGGAQNGGSPENGDSPEATATASTTKQHRRSLAPAPAIVILHVKAMSMQDLPTATILLLPKVFHLHSK